MTFYYCITILLFINCLYCEHDFLHFDKSNVTCNYMDIISDRRAGYLDWLVKKATEIHLNKNNFNSEGDFMLSQAWSSIFSLLMNEKQDKAQHILDTAH